MEPEQFERVKILVADALERDPSERRAFLQSACPDDETVRVRAAALLRLAPEASTFMERPPIIAWAEEQEVGAAPDDPSPQRVGQYRIKRRIASGGAGTVYEAVQEQPHRTVALKLLRADAGTSALAQRFERESEVLAQLHHPGIAHVYEAGVHADGVWRMPYIAMELVRDGRTIVAYANEAMLCVPERVELLIEACRAVQHGHDRGVVHRDLKPPNILVDAAGHVKVIDFGVARVLGRGETADMTMQTSVGDIIGTLPYMSPEQCGADPEAVGPRADVYALGVVLFEMLADRLPLEVAGLSLHQAVDVIRNKMPGRLARVVPGCDPDLDAITARALEKEPGRRYSSASALAADLRRFLDHQPVVARPPSIVYQTRLFARRHRVAVAAGAIAFAAMLVATAASTMFALETRSAAAAEARQRQTAERVIQHLRTMLSSSDPHVQGADATVIDMLDGMIDRLDTEGEPLPDVEAAVRSAIGETYLSLRRFESAETQLRRAADLYRALDPRSADLVMALNNLGMTLRHRGEVAAAEEALSEAVAVLRGRPDITPVAQIPVLANFATILIEQERYEEADPIVGEVIARRKQAYGPSGLQVVSSLRQLGRLRQRRGDIAGAEPPLREAQRIVQETISPRHPIFPATHTELAINLLKQGKVDEAVGYAAAGWDSVRDARPVSSPDWDVSMHTYVDALAAADRRAAVETLLRESWAALAPAVGADDERTVEVRDRLAGLYDEWGRVEEAAATRRAKTPPGASR
ncbi:MAG: serine/threonine protein kinase [Planctomycetes bacterium]|nr:serine/threonine protein kinase [Planctomycetota bacterium]